MSRIEVDAGALSLYSLLGMGISLKVYLNIIESYTESFERVLNRTRMDSTNAHTVLYKTYHATIDILDDDMYSEASILANVCMFYDTDVDTYLVEDNAECGPRDIIYNSSAPSKLLSMIESVESDMLAIKSVLDTIVAYDFEYSLAQLTDTGRIPSVDNPFSCSIYVDPLDYESDEIGLKDKDILTDIDIYIKRLDLQCKSFDMIKTLCGKCIDD